MMKINQSDNDFFTQNIGEKGMAWQIGRPKRVVKKVHKYTSLEDDKKSHRKGSNKKKIRVPPFFIDPDEELDPTTVATFSSLMYTGLAKGHAKE